MAKAPTKPSLLRLLALLKPKRGKYVIGLAGRVTISTVERLAIAIIAKNGIDAITIPDWALFRTTMIGFVLFYIGYLAVAPFVLYIWHSAIAEGTAAIREAVFRHLQRLPMGYHELHHSGDALSILTNDVSAAEKAYQEDLLRLFEASAQGLTAVVFMLYLNWQLALLIIAGGLMPLIINTVFAKPLREIGDKVQGSLGGLSERMTDLLAGYAVVRTFNLGDWILERFEQANGKLLSSSLQRVRTEAALAGANDFTGVFTTLPMIFAAYQVLTGATTFGVLVGLIQISNNINYFVYSIGGTISRIQAALAAADRVLNLLDEPLEPETYALTGAHIGAPLRGAGPVGADPRVRPSYAETGAPTGEEAGAHMGAPLRDAGAHTGANGQHPIIRFDNVDFAYNGGGNILNQLSFRVDPGQMVAFAGPSGGGKSTIFKLLLGCYPPKQGEIAVQQRALVHTRLHDLRDQFAYVPQDAYLFAGTIYDNIRYGKPAASEAEIIASAKAAFAHDFISEFPDGYQTVVGEKGARLSGGQRQRISIARALLKDAPILLLDEATSALDSESEQIVQQALEALMRGRTTLVIAHRLSTILNADQIYVIADGCVAEAGRHEELIEQRGIYAGLVEMQYKAA